MSRTMTIMAFRYGASAPLTAAQWREFARLQRLHIAGADPRIRPRKHSKQQKHFDLEWIVRDEDKERAVAGLRVLGFDPVGFIRNT